MSKAFSWMFSAVRNLRGHPKKLVGSDVSGNLYYERLTRRGRTRRSVELSITSPDKYKMEDLPPEWDRWLRGLAETVPTMEEQNANIQYKLRMKQKIDQLKQKEQEDAIASFSTEATKSHTAQQTYDKREELARDKPTSSGTKFQPAAWKPKS